MDRKHKPGALQTSAKDDQVTNYKFKVVEIGGCPYRLPQINFNKRPFNGNQHEDRGYSNRADAYSQQSQLQQRLDENESKIEQCTVKRPTALASKPIQDQYRHFLSIPVGYEDGIKHNYNIFVKDIAKMIGQPESRFNRPSMLHFTCLMLPFGQDKSKIEKTKQVMNMLEGQIINDFVDGTKDPIYISIKGLSTFDQDPRQAKMLYFKIIEDQSYQKLKILVSKVIQAFLDEQILTKEELLHVTWDPLEKLWSVKFHLTALTSSQSFDATPVIEKYNDKVVGVLSLSEIQLSKRDFVELYDGELKPRDYFNTHPDLQGFYACEQKMKTTDDDY